MEPHGKYGNDTNINIKNIYFIYEKLLYIYASKIAFIFMACNLVFFIIVQLSLVAFN